MKFLRIELFLVLLLLLTACGKSAGPLAPDSGSTGTGGVAGTSSQTIDESDPLFICFKEWHELRNQMLATPKVAEKDAAQWALGFTANECLKINELSLIKKVYDVYLAVNPVDLNSTDWIKASAYVNLKGK